MGAIQTGDKDVNVICSTILEHRWVEKIFRIRLFKFFWNLCFSIPFYHGSQFIKNEQTLLRTDEQVICFKKPCLSKYLTIENLQMI